MEKAPTTPKDFFLFAGAIIALYGSITSFLVLTFEYIHRAFPDPAAGTYDPYAGGVRAAMASLIVLAPLAAALFAYIRRDITREPAKAHTWVRRFALMLTLFLAGAILAVDVITLITTFLGGELTTRFVLKVAVVLLVAAAVFMHFLADVKGYWLAYPRRAQLIGIAFGVLALLTVVAGFFVVGTPGDARRARLDDTRVGHLWQIQSQVVMYWQQKQTIPQSLDELQDPLAGFMEPKDPETGERYEYAATGTRSFTLCAVFSGAGDSRMYARPMFADESFAHEAGRTCFERTIDPERYPPFPKPVR